MVVQKTNETAKTLDCFVVTWNDAGKSSKTNWGRERGKGYKKCCRRFLRDGTRKFTLHKVRTQKSRIDLTITTLHCPPPPSNYPNGQSVFLIELVSEALTLRSPTSRSQTSVLYRMAISSALNTVATKHFVAGLVYYCDVEDASPSPFVALTG